MNLTPADRPSSPNRAAAEPLDPDHAHWFVRELYAHERALRAHLRHSFPAVQDVDDLIQESYLRVWQRQLRHPIEFAKSFLFAVARHLALNALRHEKSSPLIEVTDFARSSVIEDKPDASEAAVLSEESSLLLEAIDSLPPRCRRVFILRKLHGISQKQIAQELGLSEQTVQVQSSRGLRRCAEYLKKHGAISRANA